MMKAFFVNTKTGKEYEILSVNKKTGKVRLKGPHSTFEEAYDPAALKRLGYTLVQKEVEDA